jgi:3-hydroxyacyl-[acyl-carrier-protein] dehydratase
MPSSFESVLNIREIAEILPHRYPFLLIDRIVHLDLEKNAIIGQKNVTINEHFFVGHFPQVPIMPGVLILEAMAQTGGVLVHQKGYGKKIAVLLNVGKAKFRKPVIPGDVLFLHIHGKHISPKGGKIEGKGFVKDKLVVEAELSFALVDKNQL